MRGPPQCSSIGMSTHPINAVHDGGMIARLDYGTSNCAIGIWRNQKVELLPLENGNTLIPSTLRAPAQNLLTPLPKNKPSEPTRYGMNPNLWPEMRFGSAATEAYLQAPREGFYVKSPKSFLGARGLSPEIQDRFSVFVSAMTRNLFEKAVEFRGTKPHTLVIGRLVNFQGANGEDDNRRATSILENSARAGGFSEVAFLYEPMAAAMELEARMDRELAVLVVDIGGGTTDCSFIPIGPSRRNQLDRTADILGHSGERIGGNDYDQLLAFHGLMRSLDSVRCATTACPFPTTSSWTRSPSTTSTPSSVSTMLQRRNSCSVMPWRWKVNAAARACRGCSRNEPPGGWWRQQSVARSS